MILARLVVACLKRVIKLFPDILKSAFYTEDDYSHGENIKNKKHQKLIYVHICSVDLELRVNEGTGSIAIRAPGGIWTPSGLFKAFMDRSSRQRRSGSVVSRFHLHFFQMMWSWWGHLAMIFSSCWNHLKWRSWSISESCGLNQSVVMNWAGMWASLCPYP